METAKIKLIRSKRRTISLEVNNKGDVIVRAPYRTSDSSIKAFVLSKSSWIDKQLKRIKEHEEARGEVHRFSDEELSQIKKKAKEIIPKRVDLYAQKMGVDYERVIIKAQRTLWGSCSAKGNLNFNCLLVLTPPEILDYVVVHELSHLIHMNHSKSFWDVVKLHCPNYQECRTWLKRQGADIIACLS